MRYRPCAAGPELAAAAATAPGLLDEKTPGALWQELEKKRCLGRCSVITRDPPTRTGCRQWYKCELLRMRQIEAYREFYINGNDFPRGKTRSSIFHNTLIRNLVRANDDGADHVAVHGIVIDRGLSRGTGTHCGHSGVNYYLDGGNETFGVNGPGETWCSLELEVAGGSRLTGGRRDRFCIDTPLGQPCLAAQVLALLVPIDSAVSFTQGDEPRQALAEWLYEQALLASSRPLADAGAWPSSASQLAGAKAERKSPRFEPDWGDGDTMDETEFDGRQALRHDLEKEMGPATAGALLGGMEQEEVREALLPALSASEEMANMQRLKEAAPEHVR